MHWYEQDTRFLPAHWQPAVFMDLVLPHEPDEHRLLRGTGLFSADIIAGRARVSPQQFLQLLDNGFRLLPDSETPFRFGQRLLPGHYGAASVALQQAENLQQALQIMGRFRAQLSPLLTPRLVLDETHAWLYWTPAVATGTQHRALVEAQMTAVNSLCHWLSGDTLPWRYLFQHDRPRWIEQYWVHLGEQLAFGMPLDAMAVPREWLLRPWPRASRTAGAAAVAAAEAERSGWPAPGGFLDVLQRYLLSGARAPLSLEYVAKDFAMSPATFKRKLKKHGTHFQHEYDRARTLLALYLYQVRGCSSDEVAATLQFHDRHNFRRSFIRWTGHSPAAVRAQARPA